MFGNKITFVLKTAPSFAKSDLMPSYMCLAHFEPLKSGLKIQFEKEKKFQLYVCVVCVCVCGGVEVEVCLFFLLN